PLISTKHTHTNIYTHTYAHAAYHSTPYVRRGWFPEPLSVMNYSQKQKRQLAVDSQICSSSQPHPPQIQEEMQAHSHADTHTYRNTHIHSDTHTHTHKYK